MSNKPKNTKRIYPLIGKDKQEYNRFKQYKIKSNMPINKRIIGQLLSELYPPFI